MTATPTYALINYALYLSLSLAITYAVGRTLFKNGRIFLIEAFHDNRELADSVSHLLLVGFYLINFGFVCIALQTDLYPRTILDLFEHLSTKVGLVMLILGVIHSINVCVFNRMRKKAQQVTAGGLADQAE